MTVEQHVASRILSGTIIDTPWRHMFVEDVFPDDFYNDLLASLPKMEEYGKSSTTYPERGITDAEKHGAIWKELSTWIKSDSFRNVVFDKFAYRGSDTYYTDLRLVRDTQHYQIGPHTDGVAKVFSLLFYLPPNDDHVHLGTSLYTHKKNQTCAGNYHHEFEGFNKVKTMPFKRNSLFIFSKTDRSFHGVEKINEEIERNVLLFNIFRNI